MDTISIGTGALLSPPVLFFLLGLGAGLARSDLSIPEAVGKGLAIYLMVAIGFKGGVAFGAHPPDWSVAATAALGIALSLLLPFAAFALLTAFTPTDRITAAAIAGHYGSVSVVTFVTAATFLTAQGIGYEGYMPAVMALMETPAIITALFLARRFERGSALHARGTGLAREIALNGSVVLLIGGFAIGWASGETGAAQLAPFTGALFPGLLCLFLLDMGLLAARQSGGLRKLRPSLIAFGLYMPLVGAAAGLAGARLVGLGLGGTTLMAVLAASASYIAVPAVMRIALPKADPSVYLPLSLAVTFPFNVLAGIPLYHAVARLIAA